MRKLSLILAIILIFVTLGCIPQGVAFAAPVCEIDTSNYTDVMQDLQKDESFDYSLYKDEFYGRYVVLFITLAESVDGEVFVYCALEEENTATSINISTGINDNLKYSNYSLTLLSRHDFTEEDDLNCNELDWHIDKYLVNGLSVKSDVVRYYDISAVYREWDPSYDFEAPDRGNTIQEKAFAVSKLITACTLDGEVTYTEEHSEVIYITGFYTGNLLYVSDIDGSGNLLDWGGVGFAAGTSHYVVFSTHRQIDKLQEADVGFVYQNWTYDDWTLGSVGGIDESKYVYEDPVSDQVTLYADNEVTLPGTGSRVYTWKRIQSVADFIADNEDLKSDVVDDIKDLQWVLRFYETEIKADANIFKVKASGTKVSKVMILRLKFLANGQVYNLGAVSNKQTGSGYDNVEEAENFLDLWEKFVENWNTFWESVGDTFKQVGNFFKQVVAWFSDHMWVVWVCVGLVAISVLSIFVKPVWFVVKLILKGLWYVISAPARLIVAIANAIKERSSSGGSK